VIVRELELHEPNSSYRSWSGVHEVNGTQHNSVSIWHHFRCIFMVALWNRADHYIFALWFLSSSFFFSFLA